MSIIGRPTPDIRPQTKPMATDDNPNPRPPGGFGGDVAAEVAWREREDARVRMIRANANRNVPMEATAGAIHEIVEAPLPVQVASPTLAEIEAKATAMERESARLAEKSAELANNASGLRSCIMELNRRLGSL